MTTQLQTQTYYFATPSAYCPSGIWKPESNGSNRCITQEEYNKVQWEPIVSSIFLGIGVAVGFATLLWFAYWIYTKRIAKVLPEPNNSSST